MLTASSGFKTTFDTASRNVYSNLFPVCRMRNSCSSDIHRNTFINSPKVLNETLATKNDPRLFFAGQITGVEGYVESVATGWLAGLNAVRVLRDQPLLVAPST